MSLAVAEAIVSGERWTALHLARRFVEAFRRDPREGYAGGFYAFLQEVTSGEEFLSRIRPDSDKSGAAMRAGPLGVLPTVGAVVERCRVQAALTHDTPDGINAATAAALMTHYMLYRLGPKKDLGSFLESQVPGQWSAAWHGKVGPKGWMSVRAAVTAVMRNERLSELLKDCIAFSGDVDTVATIALAAASCSAEYAQDLPENLVLTLENGPFGRDYLIEVDRKLLALAGGRHDDAT
jgi:ADP-ribosylglycohydrolase